MSILRAPLLTVAALRRTVCSNETILAVSLEHDNFDLVDALLEKGASVNKASTGGQSPLFIAATHGTWRASERVLGCWSVLNRAYHRRSQGNRRIAPAVRC